MSGETVWDVQADEGRYEHDRVEAEEPWWLENDEPAPHDLAGPPRRPVDSADPWRTIVSGTRVYHVSRAHETDARRDGTGYVIASRRLGDDIEYLVCYDRGGDGWHGSTDIRMSEAGGRDDPPF